MAAVNPITDRERRRIVKLHAQGHNRNQIAKDLGRSGSTISKVARSLGLTFDRERVKAATEAKVADAKARRAQLMLDLLDDAARLRAQLFAPCVVHAFGGKDNTYAEASIPEPTFADKRNLVQAVSTAVSTSLRLDQHDGDASIEGVGSLLGSLFDNLRGAHDPAPAADDG